METSAGFLLGGRVAYAQPQDGYRTGIEPVLLAAAIPARPGQRVLEAGTGAGAGLLCLATRLPVRGIGVELDPDMAALARRNLAALPDLEVMEGDILQVALEPVEHAFANPPWHDPRSTASPLERRRLAKQGDAIGWIAAMARLLRPDGTLSLILPAGLGPAACTAMAEAGFGSVELTALQPKAGRPPRLAIVQGRGGPVRVVERPPLVLHREDGGYTSPIERVLRHGAALFEPATAG